MIYNVRVHDHHDAPKQLILQMLWHGVTTRWNYKPNNSHSAWALGSVHPYIRRFAHSRGPQGPRSGGRSIRSWENWGHGILLIFPFMFSGVTMITVIIEYIFLWMQLMHLEVVPVFSNQWMWQLFSDFCAGHLYEYMHGWHGATPACWRGCCAVLHHATPPDDCVQWCHTNDKS